MSMRGSGARERWPTPRAPRSRAESAPRAPRPAQRRARAARPRATRPGPVNPASPVPHAHGTECTCSRGLAARRVRSGPLAAASRAARLANPPPAAAASRRSSESRRKGAPLIAASAEIGSGRGLPAHRPHGPAWLGHDALRCRVVRPAAEPAARRPLVRGAARSEACVGTAGGGVPPRRVSSRCKRAVLIGSLVGSTVSRRTLTHWFSSVDHGSSHSHRIEGISCSLLI